MLAGFMLTGVPLVIGEHPGPQIAKAEASLAKIERAPYRPFPAYVLVLRIVLAYVVSALDYVYKAMPPCPTRLRSTQSAVDKVPTAAGAAERAHGPSVDARCRRGLRLPPPVQTDAPPACQGFLTAMDSRSVFVRENARALRHPDNWKGLDSPDHDRLLHTMAHLEVHVFPATTVQPAAVLTWVYRPFESGGFLLAAHGAMEVTLDGDTLGWGALVADAARVLATIASGVLTRAASPCPGEWAGKLEAWRLAKTLVVVPAAVQYLGGDCTSATLCGDGGVPS